MTKYFFVGVNYGTSSILADWIESAHRTTREPKVLVVDNYHSADEREKTRSICAKYKATLLERGNIGYGRGLNEGIIHCGATMESNAVIICGNIDVTFTFIPEALPVGRFAYIPQAIEQGVNINPFLTKLQRRCMIWYHIAHSARSIAALRLASAFNSLAKNVPSRPWTTHGSIFAFSSPVVTNEPIFNEASFLYCEELEYGSYLEAMNCKLIDADICYTHHGHAATKDIACDLKKFMNHWVVSYSNWRCRWGNSRR